VCACVCGKIVGGWKGEKQIVKIADLFLLSRYFTFNYQNLRICKQKTT
jgi:hypothetical protein